MRKQGKNSRKLAGFTLIEAMISILILSFGVLSLAAVYAQGIMFSSMTQFEYIAEKKAEEAVETIFTARDTKVLTWAQIQNISQGGVFKDGVQQLLDPGPDGLVGTADDNALLPDTIILGPGPDGILGTADDQVANLNAYMSRTIAIAPVNGETNLRQITITMTYQIGSIQRTYTLISYISAFA